MNKIFYGWWIVFACFMVAFFVAGITFYGFTAFFEPLVEEFGWSYAQVSFAASLRGMEMGILAPLVGILVDRFGARKLLTAGLIFLGCGTLLLSSIQSLAMFYGAFLLISFGAGGCTGVVTMTLIANWFDKNVGKAMGIMASGFGAGGLIIPIIVLLIDLYGWRMTSVILGLGMWIVGIPLTFIIRNKPEDHGSVPDGRILDESATLAELSDTATEIGFKAAVKNRSFMFVNLTEIIRMMVLVSVATHIMPYLSSLGVPRTTSGLTAAGIPLLSIIGRFCFGWLGDLFEKRRVMAVAYISMFLGMLAFCYANVSGLIFVFLFFFSIGFGGLAVLRASFLRQYYGRYSFGKLMGVTMGFGAAGGILGPTIAGWVYDQVESYYFIWVFLSAITGLAVFLISKVEPKAKISSTAF